MIICKVSHSFEYLLVRGSWGREQEIKPVKAFLHSPGPLFSFLSTQTPQASPPNKVFPRITQRKYGEKTVAITRVWWLRVLCDKNGVWFDSESCHRRSGRGKNRHAPECRYVGAASCGNPLIIHIYTLR